MARKPATQSTGPSADTRIAVLHGPEEMQKRDALDALRAALGAAHGQVETFVFDGKTAPLADVLDELRSFSLMQTYKIVIVDDADVFVTSHREALERYAASPVDNATLVLRSGKWNKGNLDKAIAKVGFLAKCEPMRGAEVKGWLLRRAQSHHRATLEPRAADLMIERMGTEAALMDGELGKLAVLAGEGKPITVAIVEQVVGRSSEEEGWAIQEAVLDAIGKGEGGPAIVKLHELIDLSGESDIMVLYAVGDLVRKLHLGLLLREQGMSDFQIGKELRIWPRERAQAFGRAIKGLTPAKLAAMFDQIVRLDVRAKTGRGTAMRNLEGFCAVMGDK
jgi:DNA polymerase-3 subunit delta